MRHIVAAFCVIGFVACSTAAPPPAATPAPAVPSIDPARVADLERTVNELLDRIEVLNARMQRIESGREPAALVAAAPVPTRPATPVPAASTATVAPSTPTAEAKVQRPPTTAGSQIAEEYRSALALYGQSNFAGARDALMRVLNSDPNGELADNAVYWIGETYFATGNYSDAMKYYRRVFTDFADQNKAPDAMFKLGLAYEKIGDLVLARSTFEELVQKYPYSTPASSARNELKRIKY